MGTYGKYFVIGIKKITDISESKIIELCIKIFETNFIKLIITNSKLKRLSHLRGYNYFRSYEYYNKEYVHSIIVTIPVIFI